jgi:hypothetical protein
MEPGCKILALKFYIEFFGSTSADPADILHLPLTAKLQAEWLARVSLHIDYDIYTAARNSY